MMSWEDAREKLAALQKASRPPEKTVTIQKWLEDWANVYLAMMENCEKNHCSPVVFGEIKNEKHK